MTNTFKVWLSKNLDDVYGKGREVKPVLETVKYESVDDCDKPGLVEHVEFDVTNGDKYCASFWHNDHYRKFARV